MWPVQCQLPLMVTEDVATFDVLRALFPAGTMRGSRNSAVVGEPSPSCDSEMDLVLTTVQECSSMYSVTSDGAQDTVPQRPTCVFEVADFVTERRVGNCAVESEREVASVEWRRFIARRITSQARFSTHTQNKTSLMLTQTWLRAGICPRSVPCSV